MKQLIILLLIIIAGIIGYGKYNQYKRYHSPNVDYKTDKKIDLEYYNQEMVLKYHKAIEELNSFVKLQWTANDIDVRTPEDDDEETKFAITYYADKLATVKYYESKLEKSALLKEKGASNDEVKFLENTGTDLASHKKSLEIAKIKSMFNPKEKNMIYGQKNALIYEVQKKLAANGLELKIDGIFKKETMNAIKTFEENNNLFPDGFLDILTLDALFKD